MKNGTRSAASESIENIIPSTETSFTTEDLAKFESLKEMFPTLKEDEVFLTLSSVGWDVDAAISDLQKQVKKGPKKGKKSTTTTTTTNTSASAPGPKKTNTNTSASKKVQAAPAPAATTPASTKKPTIQRPPAVAHAPAPAPATPAVDAGVMLNISKSLEEQIAEVQRQAALLISIKEELAKATRSGDEQIEKLKKELAELEAEEKRVNDRLVETRKKLATIDDKIEMAEKNKDSKVNAFISSCKDKGLKVKL